MTAGGCWGVSFLLQSLAKSFLSSVIVDSFLDFVDAWFLIPPSTELSRLFRNLSRRLASVVVCLDHGDDFMMSARVSRRCSLFPRSLFPEPPPPLHSRRMSVNWAKLDRRRRWFGVVDSCNSFGGDIDVIWVAESRLPVPGREGTRGTIVFRSLDLVFGFCACVRLEYRVELVRNKMEEGCRVL